MLPEGHGCWRLLPKYADSWNDFLAYANNEPGELTTSMNLLDEACNSIGRDPSTLERSAALAVAPIDGTDFSHLGVPNPIAGSPDRIAQRIKEFFDGRIFSCSAGHTTEHGRRNRVVFACIGTVEARGRFLNSRLRNCKTYGGLPVANPLDLRSRQRSEGSIKGR